MEYRACEEAQITANFDEISAKLRISPLRAAPIRATTRQNAIENTIFTFEGHFWALRNEIKGVTAIPAMIDKKISPEFIFPPNLYNIL
jgi:hypothetical protein